MKCVGRVPWIGFNIWSIHSYVVYVFGKPFRGSSFPKICLRRGMYIILASADCQQLRKLRKLQNILELISGETPKMTLFGGRFTIPFCYGLADFIFHNHGFLL